MDRFRQQNDLPWIYQDHSREPGCVHHAGAEIQDWKARDTGPHRSLLSMLDREDFCETAHLETAQVFGTLGLRDTLLHL
jgi:hypothetical protein